MTKPMNRYFGAPNRRNEDFCPLTGQALFVDDINMPDLLHAAFVRSSHAHARILSIDGAVARDRNGVVAVFTAVDLGEFWTPVPLVVPPSPIGPNPSSRTHSAMKPRPMYSATRPAPSRTDEGEFLPS